jgi:hypothetical protein
MAGSAADSDVGFERVGIGKLKKSKDALFKQRRF